MKLNTKRTSLPVRGRTKSTREREHRISQALQQVLLRTSPQNNLTGLSVQVFYEPVLDEAAVGGDSFDIVALAGDKTAVVVADASGKGLAAAERIAEVRFALRAFLREHDDPKKVLSCLNRFVYDCQHFREGEEYAFATMTLVVLNRRTGQAHCVCAGGEEPLMIRRSGDVEKVTARGAALGLFAQQEYKMTTVHVGFGDTLLLVTDGLTEARSRPSESAGGARSQTMLGADGIASLAASAVVSSDTLMMAGRSVFEGARQFGGGVFRDDACLLLLRRESQ